MRLTFSEPVRPASGIEAIRNGGGSVFGGKARPQGQTLVIPLRGRLGNGAYTVRWRVISDDGHEIGGVLAFAVGSGSAPTPALSAGSTGPGAGQYAARWFFLIGLLVAAGAAVFHILVWRPGIADAGLVPEERRRAERRELEAGSLLLSAGFAAAIGGALLLLYLTHAGSGTRFGLVLKIGLTIAAVGLVAAVNSLVLRHVRVVALLAALAVLPIPTLAGHALDQGRSSVDLVVDVAHVTAAAVWIGGVLALAAVVPWAGRGPGEGLLLPVARRFSTLALNAVASIRSAAPAPSGPPALPPPGALVLAREEGKLAVALAAEPERRGRTRLTATIVGQDGTGVRGLAVTFRLRGTAGATLDPGAPCGSGCYTAVSGNRGKPLAVRVGFAGEEASSVRFRLPSRWPAPEASALLRRATRTYERLRSVSYVERLSSGPGARVTSIGAQVAPDRFSYRIPGGPAGIVIGTHRWDRSSASASWRRSGQSPIRVPVPIWSARATNVRLLSATKSVLTVSFLNRSLPAWFTVRFARKTLRPSTLDMTAPAHFMHHDYRSFNRPIEIHPPR